MEDCFFDATTVDPSGSFEPIEAGEYKAMIVEATNKPTKNGQGSYLELKYQILEGQYAKRNLWLRLNLKNPSVKAVEWAKRDLSAICHAVNVLRPKSKDAILNIPHLIRVTKDAKKDSPGEYENNFKGWKRIEGATQTATATAAAPAQTTATATATGAGEKPW